MWARIYRREVVEARKYVRELMSGQRHGFIWSERLHSPLGKALQKSSQLMELRANGANSAR